MEIASSCGLNPVVEYAEVEATLSRLDLFPCNWNEDRVHMQCCQLGDDDIGLRGGASGGIAEFATQNQKWPAFDDELAGSILLSYMWQFGSMQRKGKENYAQRDGANNDRHESSPSRDYPASLGFRPVRRLVLMSDLGVRARLRVYALAENKAQRRSA